MRGAVRATTTIKKSVNFEFKITVLQQYLGPFVELLTALVRTPLWRGGKNNASIGGRVPCRLIEQKRSELEQNTLLIEAGFKPGPSFRLFVKEA